MRTVETEVFEFDELESDAAKDKARSWFRECSQYDEWWDAVYDQAKDAGKLMGVDVDKIYFSGFWSQGDGACFGGSYEYAKGSVKAIVAEFPTDTELHEIAKSLQQIQRRHFYQVSASVKHSGHYSHEGCTEFDVWTETQDRWSIDSELEDDVKDTLRDFMRWIYKALEREYDWLNSDEQVDENIRMNEYEFTADGSIH